MTIFTRANIALLVSLSVPLPAGAATLEAVATRKNGNWAAVLYRNADNGRLFCAMESYDGNNTVFRVVRYKDTFDTFLEIHNPKWNLMEGVSKFSLSINVARDTYRGELTGKRFSDAYSHNFTDKDKYLGLLGMIGQSNSVFVENSNGTNIAKFNGTGSGTALRNYGDCLTNDWQLESRISQLSSPFDSSNKILGSYSYSSKNIAGNMIVTDISACQEKDTLGCMTAVRPLKVEIKSSNKDTGSDCDLTAIEETSGRVAGAYGMTVLMTIQDPRSNGKPNLSIKFDKSDAIVQPRPDAFALGCGAGVSYEGQWRLKAN